VRAVGRASPAPGLAIGLGRVAAVLGGIADSIDLRAALFATAAGPVLGILLAAWLPADPKRRQVQPSAAATAPRESAA
jgi:hypothetical protein